LQTTIRQKSPARLSVLAAGWGRLLPSSWRQDWLIGFLLIALTFLVYQPVWHAGFIWDDDTFLTKNPVFKSVDFKSADCLYQVWFTTSTMDYYPMTFSLWCLEWRFWGNNPLGYHLVNVLLHGLSAVLLWRVFLRLRNPGALVAGALFALHPVNVESVAWISEGKNALCMFFYVATLLAWLEFEESGRRRWYGLALAGFALSLLSKSAAAPLPVVLLGLAWWRRKRVEWKDVRQVVPFFVIAAAVCWVTVWFHYHRAIGHDMVRTDGFWARLAGAGWVVWFYLYKAVLPLNLAFAYPRWQIDARNVSSYVPLVLLAAAFVLCWRFWRGWGKPLFFGLAYFVVMLLPVLGFLNIYYMRFSLVADHWQYFAIIGPIALVAAMIKRPVAAAALMLALGALTWKQCGMYTDLESLWRTSLRHNPNSCMAHLNLGVICEQKGKIDEAMSQYQQALQINPDSVEARLDLGVDFLQQGKLDEAVSQFQNVLKISPDNAQADNSLGDALLQKGKPDEAIAHFRHALQLDPRYAKAHNNLGDALLRKGQINEAIAQFQEAVEFNPDLAEAHDNLGNSFAQLGRMEDAIAQFRKAVQIKPDYEQAHLNLGNALLQEGKLEEAITHYERALQINPGYGKARSNLGSALLKKGNAAEAIAQFQQALQIDPADPLLQNKLAWLLATCAEASLRDGKKAVELARQASALTGGNNLLVLHTLAAALAEAGQFPEAVETAQRALSLAAAQPDAGLAQTLQFELSLYQTGNPLHAPAQTH
jgi:tetratricopeptide (TPR) repeat protein